MSINFNMGMQNPMMGGGMGMSGMGMGMPGMGGGMGMPGMGGMNGMGGMGGQNPMMMMQMMMQMMQMMMQMMQMMMGGGCSPMMGGMDGMGGMGMPGMGGMGMPGMGGMGGGFSPALGNNIGNFLGMPGMGGMGGQVPMSSFNGNGSDAVRMGEQFLGRNSADIKGQLPHFTAAGGQTNNCADFVSSCLESTGRIQGHHVNVKEMEQALIKQGYRQIPLSQAQPGDVWMNAQRGHTELVTGGDGKGGVNMIGSNNDRPGHQVISRGHATSGVVYSKR